MKKLRLALPKGKINEKVIRLLNDAGLNVRMNGRDYRPKCDLPYLDIKLFKPQNIPQMVALGKMDIGFTGYDWIFETKADVEELIDLGFDPVRIVAAIPKGAALKPQPLIVSEYERIVERFIKDEKLEATVIKAYGATEVFPPEDADMIIDNTSTGETLDRNNLQIYKEILTSSTRFIANKDALASEKKELIEEILLSIKSVLIARDIVLLEMNVAEENYAAVVKLVPCMKSPTVNKLFDGGYAVKSAVPRKQLTSVITKLKKAGATDILAFDVRQVTI